MRSIYKIVVCSLLTLSITSCEKDLLEKEQYQKEIYLIGAYNRVWTTEVSYSNEEVKTYFTVSSSGTLALDRDVNVKMKINEELVDIYNKKYWTVLNEDKYYKSLDTDLYSIPSLENTVIKHAEGSSAEVPVSQYSICTSVRLSLPVQKLYRFLMAPAAPSCPLQHPIH